MDKRLYWLWLQYVLRPASVIKPLIDSYGTVENFYQAGEDEWDKFFGGNRKAMCRRAGEKSPEDFSDITDFCDKHALHIITPDSEFYPAILREIKDFPAVLFVRGDYKCLGHTRNYAVSLRK